jgi:hypothetical protein
VIRGGTRGVVVPMLGLVLLAACAAPAPKSGVQVPAARREALPRRLALEIDLTDRGIHVRVAASGSADDVRVWKLGDDEVDGIEVLDENDHPIPFRREGKRIETEGGRATTILRYDVRVADPARTTGLSVDEDPRATLFEARRFRALGERILALPEVFEANAVPVAFEQRSNAAALVVGSSFGTGRGSVVQKLELPGRALRRAVYLAGPGGRTELDAPEGHDESAWLGYTAFDPRAVSAEVAVFRGLLHEYFKDIELPPATLFFTVDARPRGHFRVIRTHSGVLVTLSGLDPYDAALRLSVAHELVHAWIGERIWVGDPSPGQEASSYWFHEGVTRWVAREQLARSALLSSDEYAAEVNRLLAIVTTSRHGNRTMAELVVDRTTPGVVPLLVARGALFATAVDARIREASRGARSFDDVLRALAVRSGERRGPLPGDAVGELLTAELGAGRARTELEDFVLVGRKKRLPDTALGPCFEVSEVAYEIYEPGFDVAGSRAAHVIAGVEPQGPAAAAGLRNGDGLTTAEVPERADQTATVEVAREGRPLRITYRPSSGSRRGQAFRRKPALGEEACRKLALRK